MSQGTPIVTCGNNKHDATAVHAGMKPEYEVKYAGFQLPETLRELPLLLSGQNVSRESLHTQIASNNFDPRPVVVVCGGGYDDNAYEALRNACIEACGSESKVGVAFFRADNQLTDRLVAEGKGPQKRTPEYGAAIGKRLKTRLQEVGVDKGLSEKDFGALFWY